jgi:hypothetical protein
MFALSKKSVRFLNRKDNPVGFMNDEELKAQQASEAAGTAPELSDEAESSEGSEGDAGAQAAPEGSTEAPEPTPKDVNG